MGLKQVVQPNSFHGPEQVVQPNSFNVKILIHVQHGKTFQKKLVSLDHAGGAR